MAEENPRLEPVSSDDIAVLRVLLHTIRGISPVSVSTLSLVPFDEE